MNISKLVAFALLGCIGLTSFELKACVSADSEELPVGSPILTRQNAQIPITFKDRGVSDVKQDLEATTPTLLERLEKRADAHLAKKDKPRTARHYKEISVLTNEKLVFKGSSALRTSLYYWLNESNCKQYNRETRKNAKARAKAVHAEMAKRFRGDITYVFEQVPAEKHQKKKMFSKKRQAARSAKEAFWTQDSE